MTSAARFRIAALLLVFTFSCGKREQPATVATASAGPRPSILLVTLDTTRFDSIGPEARTIQTPGFNALAAQSRSFLYAYATAPQTLPSHTSMLTGLYPAGHGIHENARSLALDHPLLAEKLHAAGYRTAAFVSAFTLSRRFGLARGFDVYDDAGDANERGSTETTDRALAFLQQPGEQPSFVWVHYFDAHFPYAPSAKFRQMFPGDPYRAEIVAMDEQLGRLIAAFRARATGPVAILVVADHGEGLGDHGEAQHGNLLYQSVMHVPLLISGPRVQTGTDPLPVSTRRVFHTILDWAGVSSEQSLLAPSNEVVLGEAMAPFLEYGWQPQAMAVDGTMKVIRAGALETYDVARDPAEARDLGASAALSRPLRQAIRDYPTPSPKPRASAMTDEDRRQLASLGYVSGEASPVIRANAPRPRDMAALFPILDEASNAFVRAEYAKAIPLLEQILARDDHNLMAALRIAVAHSTLGHRDAALRAFEKAQAIAPESSDVRAYLALHYARIGDAAKAAPLLESVISEDPSRVPALEALAEIRERSGEVPAALELRRKIAALRPPTGEESMRVGMMAMQLGDTATAISSLEDARAKLGARFKADLELGVLYLASRRFEDARAALDRVPASHPDYAMALFKRAQVSVLLHEPDSDARIALARQRADATTRELIANERLFQR
jgi:choline-sulfatase